MVSRSHAASLIMPLLLLALWLQPPRGIVGADVADVIDAGKLGSRGVIFQSPVPGRGTMEWATGIGDVDGDGFDDLFLSVQQPVAGEARMTIALVYGRAGLTGRHTLEPTFPRTAFLRSGTLEGGSPGDSPAPVGDINGDGRGDFMFGYSDLFDAGEGKRAAYLVYGSAEISGERSLQEIGSAISGVSFWASDPDADEVGSAVANVGDFNGDGQQDLAIGDWFARPGGRDKAGRLYILLRTNDLPARVDLSEVGFTFPGVQVVGALRQRPGRPEPVGENLGSEVAALGDIDGDGFGDIVVKAKAIFTSPSHTYIIYGSKEPPPFIDLMSLAEEGVTHIVEPQESLQDSTSGGDFTGSFIGDVNGDGLADILFGARGDDAPFDATSGAAYILFGSQTRRRQIDFNALEPGSAVKFAPLRPGDYFGVSVASAGDLNQDGIPDLLVGASRAFRDGMENAGEAYAIHGRRDFLPEIRLAEGFSGSRILGEDIHDTFGEQVSAAGDFNGDGFQDFLVLAPHLFKFVAGDDWSKAYLIYGTGGRSGVLELLSVVPAWSVLSGGAMVTLRGHGFRGTPLVRFGTRRSPLVELLSSSELRAVVPPGEGLGSVDVEVEVGADTARLASAFEYVRELPSVDLGRLAGKGFILQAEVGRPFDSRTESGLAMGDITGDGVDELIAESSDGFRWRLSVVKGSASLPESLHAFTPSDGLTLISHSSGVHGAGCGVQVVGDVNDDGVGDLVISASAPSRLSAIIFGRRDLPREVDVDALRSPEEMVRFERREMGSYDRVGDMAPVGDLTGDGIDDFAVSNALAWTGAVDAPGSLPEVGDILYVAGRREWPEVFDLGDPVYVFARVRGSGVEDHFGMRLSDAGDVNGDGFTDLVAVRGVSSRINIGRGYVLYGRHGMPVEVDLDRLVLEGGASAFEVRGGFQFMPWLKISGAGDVNGDGYQDVLLGAQGAGRQIEGVSYLIYGGPQLREVTTIEEELGPPDGVVRLRGEGSDEASGTVGPAGDFDGDGYGDFVIGAPGYQQDTTGQTPGNLFLLLGGDSFPKQIELGDLRGHGIKIEGVKPQGLVGTTVGARGDFNADGKTDFAFTEIEFALFPVDGSRVYVIYGEGKDGRFLRGDGNRDGVAEIADAVFTLSYLFLGGEAPYCEDAVDVDDTGILEVTDAVYLLNHLFLGGPAPARPYPASGLDPTTDRLRCPGT